MRKIIVLLMIVGIVGYANAGSLEVSLENDGVAETDRHYTHGTRVVYSYPVESQMFPDKNALRRWVVGQYMYTPSQIDVEEIQVGDRPYAGWLYGATSISVYDDMDLDFLEINIGVTGEWSGSGDVQKFAHDLSDSTEPMGWNTQLGEKVGANLTYARRHKWKRTEHSDAIVTLGSTLGNIHVNGTIGASFRFGYNIPDDFGVIRMEPSSRGLSDFGIYGLLDCSTHIVGYNYFLQGDNAEEIYDIEKELLFYEVGAGLGLYYKKLNLIYIQHLRTAEFKEQEDYNQFGTLMLSWNF